MGDFRSFKTAQRLPAEPMQPVVDPAGWSPVDLADLASWSYRMTEGDAAELAEGIAAVRRKGVGIVDVSRELVQAQHAQLRRGKLDREREPVEPPAQVRDRPG